MKKLFFWGLSASVIGAIAVFGFYLSTPAEARIFPNPPSCTNGCPNETTATVVGRGGTCAMARSIANNEALTLARQFCTQANGLCTFSFVEQGNGCFFSNGRYQVNGHGVFTCDLC
ncbi:MAG: hypothetical protein K0U98_23660 [Deltaproteobacteria bacterium]|nr:hypothetical protein [Deltaproteobacteria bacterium]